MNDEIFEQMSGIKLPKNEKSLPITMLSRFSDLKQTFFGKILYFAVTGIARSKRKQALRLPEGQERDNKIKSADFLLRTFNSNSLTSLTMAGGNMFPYNLALGVMHISNGKIFKGLKCILTPIKAPKLPD